jgi:hypothetical protein
MPGRHGLSQSSVAGGEFFPQSGRFKNGSGFSLVTAERKRPVDLSTGLRCY